jgi:hypothetical protein
MPLWSTVGSVGIASAADQSKLLLFNSIVQLGPGTGVIVGGAAESEGISTSSRPSEPHLQVLGNVINAVIRYGVDVPRETLAGTAAMRIRYRDGNGIVLARLVTVDFASGAESTLIAFDSRSFGAPKSTFQTRFATPAQGGPIVVPSENVAFYIEVTLSLFERIGVPVLVAFPPAVAAMALGFEIQ